MSPTQPVHPAKERFTAMAGELAEMFSFNRSVGQIFGFLFLCKEPVSLEEIAKACHMSKGNASIHLRSLENWGAVRPAYRPGTRKDYYEAASDLRQVAIRRLQEGVSKRLEFTRQRMESIKGDPLFKEAMHGQDGKHWEKRFEEAEKLLHEVETGFAMLPKLLKLKSILPL